MAETKNYHGLARDKSGQPLIKNVPPGDDQVKGRVDRRTDSKGNARPKASSAEKKPS